MAAVRDLSPEESAVLQASARVVADAMWEKQFVDRLEVGLLGRKSETEEEPARRAEQAVAASAR